MFSRPDHSEYAEFYRTYVDPMPDDDILDQLSRQRDVTTSYLSGLTAEQAGHRYESGKWSPREVLGHLTDAERVFALRALWFARGDGAPLPGFDENAWAARSNADQRSMAGLVEEFDAVRTANIALFRGFDADAGARIGTASGKQCSVRALIWIIGGHERHHIKILRERYFPV